MNDGAAETMWFDGFDSLIAYRKKILRHSGTRHGFFLQLLHLQPLTQGQGASTQ